MSDIGRKNLSDKITESVKPDSEKSAYEKTKEQVTDQADKLASKVTPDNQKSFTQTLGDKAQSGSDKAKSEANQNQSSLADTANQYLDAGKEKLNEAVEYVSGALSGAKEGADSTKK
ncbi:hypothetical protein KL905_000885 [Ogataea polymorpha]|uniref:Uncharacterized protein n=1 Tax=Ogataea polymorpha TaxID=460523 RepID=A0A1B7SGS0_9ASCO|nr:uncharacterized protein OGAPODRAFT_16521 [Ogataea polymorpha]KAG7881629.1 hypothetical protein KL937_001252 [Ogataea polymorpha]KAG7890775.1 hypothetical protein KL936_002059 [Ogataea polymorpha]KAG7893921.1 hypothetical protein KL908_002198 [Ogataea polymorpha]KAG7901875.1 hypothetical protein KL935_001835 [Ogataea polymorpha]KAG7910393.1 hypothetical protein KL907_001284 [Ogataea polymorpha]